MLEQCSPSPSPLSPPLKNLQMSLDMFHFIITLYVYCDTFLYIHVLLRQLSIYYIVHVSMYVCMCVCIPHMDRALFYMYIVMMLFPQGLQHVPDSKATTYALNWKRKLYSQRTMEAIVAPLGTRGLRKLSREYRSSTRSLMSDEPPRTYESHQQLQDEYFILDVVQYKLI